MAYVKTDWVAGVTPLSEANMDHLETQYDEAENWVFDHNAAILGSTVHNNNNFLIAYGAEGVTVSGLVNNTWTKVRGLTAIAGGDPTTGIDITDWYGASGAYRPADGAGCSATNIQDADAAFPPEINYSIVYSASDAAGTANTGIHVVTARPDNANLTIVKMSGTNFANSYYYWIQHSDWTVPVTGIYQITMNIYYDTAEADKIFYVSLLKTIPATSIASMLNHLTATPISPCASARTDIVLLTAGWKMSLGAYFTGTVNVPAYYSSASLGLTGLKLWLLKQTA